MKHLRLFLTLFATVPLVAQPGNDIAGNWRTPGGAVVRVAPCGNDLCAKLIQIEPSAPSRFDIHNPDPSRRSERLCGLQIGYGFHLSSPGHANGGFLYDPKTGKTYHGEMTVSGDHLDLRGFVGISLFGRNEQWTRVSQPVPGCA